MAISLSNNPASQNAETFNWDKPGSPFYRSIYIDLVDACNLSCPTCPRGLRLMPNSPGRMDVELFTKIMRKAARLGLQYSGLFNWTEPFLHPDIAQFTRLVKKHGLTCILSSNLSLPSIPDLIPALENCDHLIVSVSGFYQRTHSINHRGSNIKVVKKHLAEIAQAKSDGKINTFVEIRYFNFDYALPEFDLFKKFAELLGLGINLWKASGQPKTSRPAMTSPETDWRTVGNWFISTDKIPAVPKLDNINPPPDGLICYSSADPMLLDYKGDAYLCCLMPNFSKTRIGNFLTDDFDVLQYRRYVHPLCAMCMRPKDYSSPVEHLHSLARGCIKSLDVKSASLADVECSRSQAQALSGREVYFFGCGQMYQLKKYLYAQLTPRAILVDVQDAPQMVDGIPVRSLEESLGSGEILPIVVFAGAKQQKFIAEKIKARWPACKEIYFCPTLTEI